MYVCVNKKKKINAEMLGSLKKIVFKKEVFILRGIHFKVDEAYTKRILFLSVFQVVFVEKAENPISVDMPYYSVKQATNK